MYNGKTYTLMEHVENMQKTDDENMYVIIEDPDADDTFLKVKNTQDLMPAITQFRENFSMVFEHKSLDDFPWYSFTATWNYGEYNREATIITYSHRAYCELLSNAKN